jgi:hypothetical protein
MTDSWSSNKHAPLSKSLTLRRRAATGNARAIPFRPGCEFMEDRMLLSTFLVSNTGDAGTGSLRQAIVDSNADTGQANMIDFDFPGSGVQTIAPQTEPRVITNPVLNDGWSQPGHAGSPLIELSGTQAGAVDGLTITGAGLTVRGLEISSFSQGAGIRVMGGQTDLITVNAGSNDLTVISNFDSRSPVTTAISFGGLDPETRPMKTPEETAMSLHSSFVTTAKTPKKRPFVVAPQNWREAKQNRLS